MAKIVSVDGVSLRDDGEINYWVAWLDKEVEVFGQKSNYIYCLRATDELSAYVEAMEYLNDWTNNC